MFNLQCLQETVSKLLELSIHWVEYVMQPHSSQKCLLINRCYWWLWFIEATVKYGNCSHLPFSPFLISSVDATFSICTTAYTFVCRKHVCVYVRNGNNGCWFTFCPNIWITNITKFNWASNFTVNSRCISKTVRCNSSLHNACSHHLGCNIIIVVQLEAVTAVGYPLNRPDTEKRSARSRRRSLQRGPPPSTTASARNTTLYSLVTSKLLRLNCRKESVSNSCRRTFSFLLSSLINHMNEVLLYNMLYHRWVSSHMILTPIVDIQKWR